jgi:hypothetical protein
MAGRNDGNSGSDETRQEPRDRDTDHTPETPDGDQHREIDLNKHGHTVAESLEADIRDVSRRDR